MHGQGSKDVKAEVCSKGDWTRRGLQETNVQHFCDADGSSSSSGAFIEQLAVLTFQRWSSPSLTLPVNHTYEIQMRLRKVDERN
ncbi:hypothetical protein AMECASPLE_033250 [Ameca splendens]|uniref:Uncharacterized protein n=1 Tax=Ameca splendens TaxID=208324 RepID=A0ABV0YI79_9TELE